MGSRLGPTAFVYLMTEGLSPTVIDSQVLDTLRAAARRGITFDLVATASPRDWLRNWKAYSSKKQALNQELHGQTSLFPLPRINQPRVRDGLAFALAVRYRTRERLVFHCRSHMAADVANRVKRFFRGSVSVIADIRGDVRAEYTMAAAQGDSTALERLRCQEEILRAALMESERVFVVSKALESFLCDTADLEPEKTHVFPCLGDGSRFRWEPELRREWRTREGLEGKTVVVFPGSTGRWHHIPATLRFLALWMERNPTLYFLALCPDVTAMETECAKVLPPARYRILKAPHGDVPGWLNASDAGILLRADDPVNRVASPTKFAEYALCGLPVAISSGIGDYSERVVNESAGFLVDDDDLPGSVERAIEFLQDWSEQDRVNWGSRAAETLSKESHLDQLVRIYRSLEEA